MDADDERLTDWGASRRTYYGGDTADLEIGQKDEDAGREEAFRAGPAARGAGRAGRGRLRVRRWTMTMRLTRQSLVIYSRRWGGRAARAKPSIAKQCRESSGGAGGARRGRRAKCDNLKTLREQLGFIMRRGLLRTAARGGRRCDTTPDRAAFAHSFTKFGGLS